RAVIAARSPRGRWGFRHVAWLMNLHDPEKEEERVGVAIANHEAPEDVSPDEPVLDRNPSTNGGSTLSGGRGTRSAWAGDLAGDMLGRRHVAGRQRWRLKLSARSSGRVCRCRRSRSVRVFRRCGWGGGVGVSRRSLAVLP